MGRRRKRDAGDDAEALVKGGFFLVLFLALAIGGITKRPQTLALLAHLLWWSVGALLVLAVGGVAIWLGWRAWKKQQKQAQSWGLPAPARLERLLQTGEHHGPKCEAPMVWRTGDFEAFWGCSRYPRCRSILRER